MKISKKSKINNTLQSSDRYSTVKCNIQTAIDSLAVMAATSKGDDRVRASEAIADLGVVLLSLQ